MNLWEVLLEIEVRLIWIFFKDENGKCLVYVDMEIF